MKHFFVIVVAFLFSISLFADEYQSTLERITGAQVKSTAHVTTKQVNAPNDGQKDALPAFRKAIQRLQKSGGGTFVVTRGVYLLNGPLELISNLLKQRHLICCQRCATSECCDIVLHLRKVRHA